jgi:hypothetical protein
MAASIDTTIKALQNGITDMSPEQGVKNIDGWILKLESADFRGAKGIRDNLVKLKKHLESGHLDGAAIGQLLGTLANSTVRAAGQASGKDGTKVQQLGEALSSCADELKGSSAPAESTKASKRGQSASQGT